MTLLPNLLTCSHYKPVKIIGWHIFYMIGIRGKE